MTLDELESIVAQPLAGQLRSRYAEFIQAEGKGDIDVFVERLREQGLISPEAFREIHARDDVSLEDVRALARRLAKAGGVAPEGREEVTTSVPALQERHQILGLIGMGGMATVHVARDTDLGRKVAYKQLNPTLRADPRIQNRFFSEVQITAQLDHPNIVPVYDLVLDSEDWSKIGSLAVADQDDPIRIDVRVRSESLDGRTEIVEEIRTRCGTGDAFALADPPLVETE